MNRIFLSFLPIFIVSLLSCSKNPEEIRISALDKILERDTITVITGYNAYSYFIYKGLPMGFEYELVNKLAEHIDVNIELKIVKDISMMFELLKRGKGDLISFNLTVTKDRLNKLDFTSAINTTKQVLVQRKPNNWRNLMLHQIERKLIRNPIELIGKKIVVRKASSYIPRLQNLSDEIGGDINIVEAGPEFSIEDLIEQVAEGEIDYTVSDDNVAYLNAASFPNIDVKTDISLSQRIAWAVDKDSKDLLTKINHWLDSIKSTEYFAVIYNKYYKNRYAYKKRMESDYLSHKGGKISEYDELIKKYAKNVKWDWRILASQVYQESQFNPIAQSWAGAVGLMQLLPSTGEMFGVKNLMDPESSIKGGSKFITYLDKIWKELVPDSLERIKFVLASYNIGLGHIEDARNLAEKYGADPNFWFGNVEFYLLQKSKEQFYNDDVVKHGYSRGRETVKYVKEILERYEHYKKFVSL